MELFQPLVKMSAICVYKDGTRTLDKVKEGYRDAVIKHAGENYEFSILDRAFMLGFITESEYQETVAYKK